MTESEFATVTITGPSTEGLITIVHALVKARLAACGNVIPGVTSVYRWQNAIEEETEALALVHTRTELLPQLESLVRQLHPYDVPQIVAVGIATTTPSYADWIRQSTPAEQGNRSVTPTWTDG